MKTKRLTTLALLTGISLILFVFELQIPNPFPIPGVKLGLANIITVYAVYRYRAREVFCVLLTRILLGAFFSGNAMTLLYSLAGGALCLIGMCGLKHIIDLRHIWIASVLGAVLHNTGQIAVAIAVTKTPALLSYFPFLLLSGCLAGVFTGLCAQLLLNRLKAQK